MDNGLRLQVIWFDAEITEIMVKCSNKRFSGTAEIYLSFDEHLAIADVLSGFPSTAKDSRTIEMGTFDPAHADGGLRLELNCADSSGHVLADVSLRGGGCKALGQMESVALQLRLEPAAIDRFVEQLRTMSQTVGASAFLAAAT